MLVTIVIIVFFKKYTTSSTGIDKLESLIYNNGVIIRLAGCQKVVGFIKFPVIEKIFLAPLSVAESSLI